MRASYRTITLSVMLFIQLVCVIIDRPMICDLKQLNRIEHFSLLLNNKTNA